MALLIGGIIVAAGVLVGIVAWRVNSISVQEQSPKPVAPSQEPFQPSKPVEPSQTSSSPQIDASNWKTYRNEKYGFEVKYAQEDFILDIENRNPVFSDQIASFNLVNKANYYPNTNLSEASLNLRINQNAKTLSSCLKIDVNGEDAQLLGEEDISGVTFRKMLLVGRAMNSVYERVSYRTVRGQRCYKLDLYFHYTVLVPSNHEPVSEFNKQEITDKLRQLLSTFRFIT